MQKDIREYVRKRFQDNADTQCQDAAFTKWELFELILIAHRVAGIENVVGLATGHIRIKPEKVKISPGPERERPHVDFLNSFYLGELEEILEDIGENGAVDGPLGHFLTHDSRVEVASRIDVVENPAVVDAGVAVNRIPAGRWPSSPEHTLALSQQFAVNIALFDIEANGGIAAVNGPPGTGKTTMLRDIIAGNIVERARVLASLNRPEDGFVPWSPEDAREVDRRIPKLAPELSGFEMVVTSANNGAVENISKEIPASESIDDRWRGKTASDPTVYFADISGRIINAPSWGLIAAQLGNKKNRTEFARVLSPFRKVGEKPFKKDDKKTKVDFHGRLDEYLEGKRHREDWGQVKDKFLAAEDKVTALLDRMHFMETRYDLMLNLKVDLDARESEAHQFHRKLIECEGEWQAATKDRDKADETYAALNATIEEYEKFKPGLWDVILSFGSQYREWAKGRAKLRAEACAALLERDEKRRLFVEVERMYASAKGDYEHAEKKVRNARQKWRRVRRQCLDDHKSIGMHIPLPMRRREIIGSSAPYG